MPYLIQQDLDSGRGCPESCGTVRDVAIQHLLVVDPTGRCEFVQLPDPAQDPTCFAELVAVLGPDREVEPAGPPLRAPGHVVHRVRGAVSVAASSVPEELKPLVSVALDEEHGGPVPAERAPWCRPGWAEETAAWVDGALAQQGLHRAGRSTVLKSWGLSHVERVPTSEGPRYLKASCALFAHEPPTTAWLARVAPSLVPNVLAIDESRSCMLMDPLPPAEPGLSIEQELLATCTSMTQVQEAVVERLDELRGTGAPDRGLATTSRALSQMLGSKVAVEQLDAQAHRKLEDGLDQVLGLLDQLAACGLPDDAAVHGDLHLANVAIGPVGAVIFDWSDACLGNPMLDLAHLRADRTHAGRPRLDWDAPWVQAYLQPWRKGRTESGLRRALELADVADLAFQAVTYQRIQASLEPEARQDLTAAGLRAIHHLVDNLPAR